MWLTKLWGSCAKRPRLRDWKRRYNGLRHPQPICLFDSLTRGPACSLEGTYPAWYSWSAHRAIHTCLRATCDSQDWLDEHVPVKDYQVVASQVQQQSRTEPSCLTPITPLSRSKSEVCDHSLANTSLIGVSLCISTKAVRRQWECKPVASPTDCQG